MSRTLLLLAALVAASPAHADSLYANPNDPGRVTFVHKGVWEIDLGALGVLTSEHEGDQDATRIATDFSAGVMRFVRDNISVGGVVLGDYEHASGGVNALTFGAAAQGAVHLRLGLGAFFRPTLGVGFLVGHRQTPSGAGTIDDASQTAAIVRLQLPIAYFASKRVLLEAGPQLNITAGAFTPSGGMAQSFVRTSGGFAVGVGYAF
jgi:hypothetical protein